MKLEGFIMGNSGGNGLSFGGVVLAIIVAVIILALI